MKKVFCLIIALISVMILSLNAFAAGSVSASQKSDAYKDKSFSVDVILTDNPGVARLDVKITYNSKHLSFYNASHGKVFAACGDQSANGSVKLSYSSSSNVNDIGRLATVKFTAKAEAGTSTNLTVEITKAVDAAGNDVTFNGCTTPILIITEPTEDDETQGGDDIPLDESDDNISVDEVDENETTTAATTTKATEATTKKTKKTTEKTTKATTKTTKATTTEPTTTPEPTTSEEPSTTPEETAAPESVTEPDSSGDESSSEPTVQMSEDSDITSAPENDMTEPESSVNDDNQIPYEIPDDYIPTSANKETSHKGLIIFGIIAAIAFAVIGGVVIYIRRSV